MQHESPRLIDARDPLRAAMLLTRLPVPGADGTRGAASAWAWPLAGALVGGLGGLAALAGLQSGLPTSVAAGLALVVMAVLTGGLHEDGLADCADGFWGGQTSERRLEIMRDSRIGSYGVLAMVFGVGLRWSLIAALIGSGTLWAAFVLPAMLSRTAMGMVMAALPFARDDGLARHVGRPRARTVWLSAGLSLTAALWVLGVAAMVPILLGLAVAGTVAKLARAKIGGQTGDVLGATQYVTEIAVLLGLAIMTGQQGAM